MKKLLLLAAIAGVTSGANAQKKVKEVDSLKTYQLQAVQVTSTRANRKTPIAYSDLSKQQIKEVNYGKDIPQLLNFLPSVTTSSDAGMGIGYTGIHVRGTDPTRINITANGIPLNDTESSQLYWVNLGDLVSSVESMQIQRGAGTSVNGAGAFGASINLQTENIGIKPYAEVNLAAGSFGTHKETFKFSTGMLNNHWAIQGRLSNINSDGYIDRASSSLQSYLLQAGYFYNNTSIKFITFSGQEKTYMAWDYTSKADMEKYGRTYNPSGIYIGKDGKTAFYDNQTDNYLQRNFQLIANQLVGNWSINAALHYTRGDGYYEQYKENQKLYKYLLSSELGAKSDLIRQKKMKNDFYGVVASANYVKNALTLNFGGAWNKYDGDHFGNVIWVREFKGSIDPNSNYYFNSAKKSEGNVYAKASYEFITGFSAYADLQYRGIKYTMDGTSQEFDSKKQQQSLVLNETFNFFNPKFGLVYTKDNHTAYASFAVAHKEPTRNDFEDMMAETEQIVPQSEKLNDFELGYTYKTNKFNAGVNLYYMLYKNQFVLTGAQDANGEMVARNIKDSYRAGVELMVGCKPFRGFEWNVNATLSTNKAKNMELTILNPETWESSKANVGETTLSFSPSVIFNNIFSYEYKGFKASLFSKFIGEQYMTNSGFKSYTDAEGNEISAMIDKMFINDLSLSYSFKTKHVKNITLGITVYNIFNEEYESNGSCSMNFKNENGAIKAFGNDYFWSWATYSAQAPTHILCNVSITL